MWSGQDATRQNTRRKDITTVLAVCLVIILYIFTLVFVCLFVFNSTTLNIWVNLVDS